MVQLCWSCNEHGEYVTPKIREIQKIHGDDYGPHMFVCISAYKKVNIFKPKSVLYPFGALLYL